jgi:hypothetical protein
MIPEALPKKALTQPDGSSSFPPQLSSLFSNGRAKIFADERDGVTASDAARIWGGQGEQYRPSVNTETRTIEVMRNAQMSPIKEKGPAVGPQQVARSNDGSMFFEMDVPAVAYGTVTTGGMSGVQVGPIEVPVASTIVEETENTAARVRDVAAMAERMDNIKTERIPCPRLAGATFGPGMGGLAMFKNGDVKKMWFWYDRAGSSRLAGIPSSISAPEQEFSEPGIADKPGGDGTHEVAESKVSRPRDYPRTMKDLMSMVAAAKEAQWGEVNESDADSNDQEQSAGDNFYEYMSTGSISSDSDNEPADLGSAEVAIGKCSHGTYENYFGRYRLPVAAPTDGNTTKADEDAPLLRSSRTGSVVEGGKGRVVGPSSDTLAPSVHVTHDYDKVALNNQSAEIAKEWELGQWQGSASGFVVSDNEVGPQRAPQSDQIVNGIRGKVNQTPSAAGAHRAGETSFNDVFT